MSDIERLAVTFTKVETGKEDYFCQIKINLFSAFI